MNPVLDDRLLPLVLDSLDEGVVVVDANGEVTHLNTHAAQTLGIPASEARGCHFTEVFCPALPRDSCWVSQALQAKEQRRQHLFEMQAVDGSLHTLLANLTAISDREQNLRGAIITVREAEENDRCTASLQAEKEKQAAILGSIADGLFTVDHEWRITSFNRAAERLTGYRESEVLGRLCQEVFNSDKCRDGCPLAITLERRQNVFDYEMDICARDGTLRPVSANCAILYDQQETPMGGVVSIRDLSQLKALQQNLGASAFHGLLGQSKKMREVFQLIEEVAEAEATVLVFGESGTGKDVVARAIHQLSRRREKAFVKLNCSAFPETLLESELFGHVAGAYTDARKPRQGRFELADGGSLFLDLRFFTPARLMSFRQRLRPVLAGTF